MLSVGLLLMTAVSLIGVQRLEFDDDYRRLFQSGDQEYLAYESFLGSFGTDENDCLVLLESDEILTPEILSAVDRIDRELEASGSFEKVISVFNLRDRRRVGRYILPVLRRDMNRSELSAAIPKLRKHPLASGNLISHDGRAMLLVVSLAGESLSIVEVQTRLDHMESVIDRATQGIDVTAAVTGLPPLRAEIIRGVQNNQIVLSTLAVLVSLVLAWYLFRSIAMIVIVASPPLIGVVWALGLMGWMGESLNPLNTITPTLLIVIGFTDSVHLMFEVRRSRTAGGSPIQSAMSALRNVAPACVLTSITTAIGFGSLIVVEDTVVRRFGVSCALGTLIAMLAALCIVPLLTSTRLGIDCVFRSSQSAIREQERMGWLFSLIARMPRQIAIVAVLVTGTAVWYSTKIRPDFQFTENLTRDNAAYKALDRCETLFGGTSQVHVVVNFPSSNRVDSKELLSVLTRVHGVLSNQQVIGDPISLVTLLQSLPGNTQELHRRLPELKYVPPEAVRSFLNTKDHCATVSARVRDLGAHHLMPIFDDVRSDLEKLAEKYPEYSLQLTGLPVLTSYRSESMIKDLTRSLIVASGLIVVVLIIALRSVWLGLASVVPNIFPLAMTASLFVALDQSVRYSAVVCFSIGLGIAVDDTIHFLTRFRQGLSDNRSIVGVTRQAYITVGPALITTTLMMCIGFGVTLASQVPTIQLFGITTCSVILFALVGDLIFLPAILLAFGSNWNGRSGAKSEQ